MTRPVKKRLVFRLEKKSAPTPEGAEEETERVGDEEEEMPVSEVVTEAGVGADSPSAATSSYFSSSKPPPRLLPAFVLREGSTPLPLSEYDRIRAEAPRLLRGRGTFLRPHSFRRGGAAPSSAAAAAASVAAAAAAAEAALSSRLLSLPFLDFTCSPTPFSFGVGGGGGVGGAAAAAAESSRLLQIPTRRRSRATARSCFSQLPEAGVASAGKQLSLGGIGGAAAASLGFSSLAAAAAKDGDAEVRRQQLLLIAEEAKDKPPLGEKEPLLALAADFPADSSVIQEKIKMLNDTFASFRRVRRDGNCFYRSFILSYLGWDFETRKQEQIAELQDEAEVFRLFEHLEQLKEGYLALGEDGDRFDDCFSDFRNEVINILEERRTGLSLAGILQKNLDEYKSDTVLIFLRLVTSIDMRMREEHFSPFILADTNQKPIKEYCENEVLPLGVEAEHMQVVALSNAFCIPIRVVYLDSSSRSKGGLNHHDFIPVKYANEFSDLSFLIDGSSSSSSSSSSLLRMPVVILLYRPGHYDILYPK